MFTVKCYQHCNLVFWQHLPLLIFCVGILKVSNKMPPKRGTRAKPPPPPIISSDTSENEDSFTVEEEISWCRKKLLESLAAKHKDLKAAKPIVIALKALDNKNNPLPKLRKMMRAGCGDYRKEMKEEYERAKTESKKISLNDELHVKGTKVAVTKSKKSKESEPQSDELVNSDSVPFCFNFPSPEDEVSSEMEKLKT